MASIIFERYAIYRADLNPTRGSEINKVRPVVIVSLDALNEVLETVVVCPLTTKLHPRWRSRLQVQCRGKKAEIAVDQIRTVSKSRFLSKMDILSLKDARELRRMISEMYGEGRD
jgi:mRNA interferase MazF